MSVCLHCEQPGLVDELELCAVCGSENVVRVLYLRRRGWTPSGEEHLRRLTRRAKEQRPLFEVEEVRSNEEVCNGRNSDA